MSYISYPSRIIARKLVFVALGRSPGLDYSVSRFTYIYLERERRVRRAKIYSPRNSKSSKKNAADPSLWKYQAIF